MLRRAIAAVIALVVVLGLIWLLLFFLGWNSASFDSGSREPRSESESSTSLAAPVEEGPTRSGVEAIETSDARDVESTTIELGAIDIFVKSTATGRGLPKVPIHIDPAGNGRNPGRDGRTDADGRASFEDLPRGKWFVDCALGAREECTVEDGHRTPVELLVSGERGLAGTVKDQDGAPIEGAEVWLTPFSNRIPRVAAAITDQHGAFRIQSIGEADFFGARARGHAPSDHMLLEHDPDRPRAIQLQWNGKSIRGRVHDRQGLPVPEAIVALSGSRRSPEHTTVSDRNGLFEYTSVPDGVVRIRVAASRFSLWRTDVTPEGDRETLVDVILEMGGKATGMVRSADGVAMPGVSVRTGDGLLGTWSLSGLDGSYVLEGLDSGHVELKADADERGEATFDTECAPGCSITWNPVLGGGRRLGGIVVDESGAPINGVLVVASRGSDLRSATTGDTGRFLIADCKSSSYRLEARDQLNTTAGYLENVLADTTDARLVAKRRDALIRGTVHDAEGRELVGASVIFSSKDGFGPFPSAMSDERGNFQSTEVFAGTYEVLVHHTAFLPEMLEVEGLGHGEDRDLGTIRLRAQGSITVACRSPEERRLILHVETLQGKVVALETVTASPEPSPLRIDRLPLEQLRARLLDDQSEVAEQLFTPLAGEVVPVLVTLPARDR